MQTSGQIACLLKAKECDFWTWFCGSFYLSTYGNRETYRKSLFENLLLRMLLTSCVRGPAINRISAISLQSLDYGINVWFLFKFHRIGLLSWHERHANWPAAAALDPPAPLAPLCFLCLSDAAPLPLELPHQILPGNLPRCTSFNCCKSHTRAAPTAHRPLLPHPARNPTLQGCWKNSSSIQLPSNPPCPCPRPIPKPIWPPIGRKL